MKYFFEGQQIRASKTHHYTHACIVRHEGKIICRGCSSSKQGAEKVKADQIAYLDRAIEGYKKAIEAFEAGKSGYVSKRNGFVRFSEIDFNLEKWQEYLESDRECRDRIEKTWQIVEIEERA